MDEYWHYLYEYCSSRDLPLYALRWESFETSLIEEITRQSAERSGALQIARSANSWWDFMNRQNLRIIANFAVDSYNQSIKTFQEA